MRNPGLAAPVAAALLLWASAAHAEGNPHFEPGESFIVWDETKQSLVYYYFTTAGFHTTGTMLVEEGVLVSHETVTGDADGITEVKGTMVVRPDGRLHVKTQYLKKGQWVDGRDMNYQEDPGAVVRLKE